MIFRVASIARGRASTLLVQRQFASSSISASKKPLSPLNSFAQTWYNLYVQTYVWCSDSSFRSFCETIWMSTTVHSRIFFFFPSSIPLMHYSQIRFQHGTICHILDCGCDCRGIAYQRNDRCSVGNEQPRKDVQASGLEQIWSYRWRRGGGRGGGRWRINSLWNVYSIPLQAWPHRLSLTCLQSLLPMVVVIIS